MEDKQPLNPAGITFLIVGIGLSVSLGVTQGAAFIGTGLPMALIGLLMLRKGSGAKTEGGDRP